MRTINSLLAFFYLLAFPLQLLLISESSPNNPSRGLSIKIIHRDSPSSPHYPGNIDETERITRNVLLTAAHAGLDNSSNAFEASEPARPRVGNQGQMYFVEVGIGTFDRLRPPYMNCYLHLDTGGDTSWTQCDECQQRGPGSCFLQKSPLYPAKTSKTYRPLPCNKHPLCTPGRCINGVCSYILPYADGAKTTGYLASETLTFYADRNRAEAVRDVVFGCGIDNRGFRESSRTNLIAGNFGLGAGRLSFLDQKASVTQGRFSYCLPPWNAARGLSAYVRFGADIPQMRGLRSTSLSIVPYVAAYFLNLKGISVKNKRLDILPETFVLKKNYSGGCVLDSGASVGILPAVAYYKLTSALLSGYFSRYQKAGKQLGLDFCFHYPWFRGIGSLPSVTFHLEGSDLVLTPRQVFMEGKTAGGKTCFCLGFLQGRVDATTSIGALQQGNTRYVFDTRSRRLYYGPENCMRGG